MNAIREIQEVKSGTVTIDLANDWDAKEVEIIIRPLKNRSNDGVFPTSCGSPHPLNPPPTLERDGVRALKSGPPPLSPPNVGGGKGGAVRPHPIPLPKHVLRNEVLGEGLGVKAEAVHLKWEILE